MCDTGVSRASCAECPNPPGTVGNTWCDGDGDCMIKEFKALDGADLPNLSVDTCVSKYIFERCKLCLFQPYYIPNSFHF